MPTSFRQALHEAADDSPDLEIRPDLFDHARTVRRRKRLALAAPVAAAVAVTVALTIAPRAPDATVTPTAQADQVTDSTDGSSLLRLAANRVEAAPAVSIPRGAYIYSHSIYQQTFNGNTGNGWHQMWRDPQGLIAVRIRATEGGRVVDSPDPRNPKDSLTEEVAKAREQLRQEGPTLLRPTPEFLAGLPTDVPTLAAYFNERYPADLKRTQVQAVFLGITGLLIDADPIMTPRLRAACYRVLADLPGVTRTPGQVNLSGRRGIAIGMEQFGNRDELILDPTTFSVIGHRELVGEQTYTVIGEPGSTEFKITPSPWPPGTVDQPGTVIFLSAVDHKIVRKVGDTK